MRLQHISFSTVIPALLIHSAVGSDAIRVTVRGAKAEIGAGAGHPSEHKLDQNAPEGFELVGEGHCLDSEGNFYDTGYIEMEEGESLKVCASKCHQDGLRGVEKEEEFMDGATFRSCACLYDSGTIDESKFGEDNVVGEYGGKGEIASASDPNKQEIEEDAEGEEGDDYYYGSYYYGEDDTHIFKTTCYRISALGLE